MVDVKILLWNWIFFLVPLTCAIRHGRNLIWSMSPKVGGSVPRIVGIEGDPNDWVPSGNVTVRHISAPHSGWQFRGLAYLYSTQTLFWTERSNKRIQGLQLDGTTTTRSIFTGTSKQIDGIAVDWISLNLYVADPKYNWIMMISLNNTSSQPLYKLIIRTGLEQPHGIAVYPQKGLLIWSDFSPNGTSKIETSDLVGQNRKILVSQNLMHPRGLAVDYDTDTLYWVDGTKHTIESIDFNGNNRRILVSQGGAIFYGISIFEDYIFVTEQSEGHLRIYDKQNGKGHINYQLGYIPYGIVMYDNSTQAGDSSECAAAGCAHLCVKHPASVPRCMCADGYELNPDQTTCTRKPEFLKPSHIYAIRDAICQYPANLGDMSLKNITLDRQCFLKTSKGFLSVTYDGMENTLYYSENVTKSISRVQLRKGSFTETIIRGVGEVKGIAYDWMTKNLYWTDSTYKWIKVSSADGRYQTTVVEDNLVNPLGIVVHPQKGLLIWSDPGRSVIEMSSMNGEGRKPLPISRISHPNHLFLDYKTNILYWADSGLNQVLSYGLNSGNVEVIYRQQNTNFYGISIFQDYLIWTDQGDMNGIHVADIITKNKVRGILHPQTGVAYDVVTYDQHVQPQLPSACVPNKCQQLCLSLSNASSVCACGTGYQLSDDSVSCTSKPVKNNFLLIADGYQKHLYQLNMDIWEVNAVALQMDLQRPIAIDYDPIQQNVFWTENKLKMIGSVNLYSNKMEVIARFGDESVLDGVAVDHINRLLFFTDTGLNTIKVISMTNTTLVKTIIWEDLDEPRAIAVHPLRGRIFWTDWGRDPKIESANMDGTDRTVLVNLTARTWPNGLVVDYKENLLYWVEAKENTIESVDFDGNNRRTIIKESKAHYFDIAIMGDYLYVTDWSSRYIRRIPKKGGKMESVGEPSFSRANGIVVYDMVQTLKGRSPCLRRRCQHICLPLPGNKYTCACADGYFMSKNRCFRISDNSTDEGVIFPGDDGINIDPQSGELKTNGKSRGLSTAGITAITVAASVLLLIGIVVGIILYRRWRANFVPHERLVEDRQSANYYKISFEDDAKETISFDSGIENPSYDHHNYAKS